jgi:transposase
MTPLGSEGTVGVTAIAGDSRSDPTHRSVWRRRALQRCAEPGFKVPPRRWVVQRGFAWTGQNRRMSKDYERLPETRDVFMYVAMSRLMVRRLDHP